MCQNCVVLFLWHCLAFAGVSEEGTDSLGASDTLQLARVSVSDSISAADWNPVHQAGLVAVVTGNGRGGNADTFALMCDSHA